MYQYSSRAIAASMIGAAGLFALVGCANAAEAPVAESSQVETEAPAADAEAEATEPVESTGHAAWANPVTKPGELISSYMVGDVSVEVYQVTVAPASSTGSFVSESGTPIIAVGDDIAVINYVFTNTGAPIDLGSSLGNTSAQYDDWPYLQGMDSIVDPELYEAIGVNRSEVAPDGYQESGIYTFGTGESFSVGANFRHQAGSPITFESSMIPVDASGDLIHDAGVEGVGTGVIK